MTAVTGIVRAATGGAAVGVAWVATGLVGWTFAGYPLLAWARAAAAPRPVAADDGHTPTVSVVVPAHNETRVIVDKLTSVRAAEYPQDRVEIVVVDDGSTDGTADLIRRAALGDVRLVRQDARRGKAAAVNRGVGVATGEVVVLSDASAIFERRALRNAVRLFADPHVGVVVGAIRFVDQHTGVARPAGLYWRLQQRLARWESATGSTVGVNGNFFAFRRDTFEPLPAGTINDEFTLAMRQAAAGRRVIAGEGVATIDRASATMAAEYGRRARITAGRWQWATSAEATGHPLRFRLLSHKLSRAAVPPAFAALLIASSVRVAQAGGAHCLPRLRDVVALRDAGVWPWVAVQAALWGAGAAGLAVERRGARPPAALRVPAFLAGTTLAGLAGLQRHLTRRQSVLWTTAGDHPGPVSVAASGASGGSRATGQARR